MRRRSKHIALAGSIALVGTILLTAGAYVYMLNSSSKTLKKSSRKSRCYILSEDVSDRILDWEEELSHDVVVLIEPDSYSFGVELKSHSKFEHKIILCSNWKAIWSCVRNLRKQELLLAMSSLTDPIPKDIARYVVDIIAL